MVIMVPLQTAHAASLPDILSALTPTNSVAATNDAGDGGGALGKLLGFLFNKILGPILNLGDGISGGANRTGSLSGKVITLDPGHGGGNPGAVGPAGVQESQINLAVALKLKKLLENSGAKVVMTRSTDRYVAAPGSSLGQELQERLKIAEANNADLFISLHSNSNEEPSINGAMTFYYADAAKPLAENIQRSLVKATGAANKGVETATFYVLRNAAAPSVLVEMGFVSNPTEEQKLDSSEYQAKLAQGIHQGIMNTLAD
jgi:N-acetylmuramoyl-L-alanine amidase